MRMILGGVLACAAVAAVAGASAADPVDVVSFDADRAHVYAGGSGAPLLRDGVGTSASALLKAFLRAQGVSAATVGSLLAVGERSAHGLTHVRVEQEVGGLRVAGAYAQGAVNGRGALVHVIENVVDVGGGTAAASASAEDALAAALASVHPGLAERPAVVKRGAAVTRFERTAFFHVGPKVERVLLARTDGVLQQGFLVETWSKAGNLLHVTQVLGDGRVAATELRTANDSYNVFREDPLKGAQTVVLGPAPGGTESPEGWLSPAAQLTTNIVGNNVNAYPDADANNRPDRGGTGVNNGAFLTAVDLTQSPTTAQNRAVAVQNLFYLNNVVHDELYSYGFDESAGNFQEDNFGRGGADSDSVFAEAQDSAFLNNSTFATPSDGSNPRMTMYLWSSAEATSEVVVGGSSYGAWDAEFGKQLAAKGVTGPIVLVDDGVANPSTSDTCEPLPARSLRNTIALVDRGECSFVVKVANAQNAGAAGVIVGNNVADRPFVMGGTPATTIRIPAVMISQADRNSLVAQLPASGTMRRLAQQPPQIDGDLDSDVVYHEYGHGLTWRMIGGMSGPLGGAVGEGGADTLAMLINGDDRIAEYSTSSPIGLRSMPYTGYSRTYGDVDGGAVHFDGEVYAAIMWRLIGDYALVGLSSDKLFRTWVDGMNYTPATPAFEDMRDGMLASAENRGASPEICLIWNAFASFGVGVSADGVAFPFSIAESFEVPPGC